MRLPFFNHHKMRRSVTRQVQTARQQLSSWRDTPRPRRRDFSWQGMHVNPHTKSAPITKGLWWKSAIIFISSLTIILVGLLHSTFAIKNIIVQGTTRISAQAIHDTAAGILVHRVFGIISGENFFVIRPQEIKNIISDRFPVSDVQVSKQFPDTLTITITEKKPAIIYDNGIEYSYLGSDGRVTQILRLVSDYEWINITRLVPTSVTSSLETFSTTTTPTNTVSTTLRVVDRIHRPDLKAIAAEYGTIPLLVDKRPVSSSSSINFSFLDENETHVFLSWATIFSKQIKLPIQYMTYENAVGDIVIKTQAGWELRARISEPIDRQLHDAQVALKKISDDKIKFSYLDVRYDGKVYWQ